MLAEVARILSQKESIVPICTSRLAQKIAVRDHLRVFKTLGMEITAVLRHEGLEDLLQLRRQGIAADGVKPGMEFVVDPNRHF